MDELAKSIARRIREPNFATRYFVGDGIDLGCGRDHLALYAEFFPLMRSVTPYDLIYGQQDAATLPEVPDEAFDFVHSSHCLEHLPNPVQALTNWFRVLRPGGHVVFTVPDEDLYEQGLWPSAKNPDHKHTWTIHKAEGSWSVASVSLLKLLAGCGIHGVEVIKVETLTGSYRYSWPPLDQTMTPIGECAIEVILRKRHPEEARIGGRLPQAAPGDQADQPVATGETTTALSDEESGTVPPELAELVAIAKTLVGSPDITMSGEEGEHGGTPGGDPRDQGTGAHPAGVG